MISGISSAQEEMPFVCAALKVQRAKNPGPKKLALICPSEAKRKAKELPMSRLPIFVDLPESAWTADKIFVGRATYFTNGELGTGNAEFSEPEEENIYCLCSAIQIPN
jgi:hypothetical protein